MPNDALILLVEDNEDHVFLLRHAFKKAGITNRVHVSKTGEDAITFLEGTEIYSEWHKFPLPVLVLLDLKLPGCSGFDVLKWIRQHGCLRALRVVVLTSSDLGREIKVAYELGANAFITKPVDLDRLVEIARTIRVHWLEVAQIPEISRTR